MSRPTIEDENGDGHFGYGELLKPATVDALISQHNEHAAALDALEAGGGGGGNTNKPFGDISEWYDAPSANMPAGIINDYAHPSLQTHTILQVRGADNNGTTLTGMDSTGITAGTIRVFYDTSNSEEDVGNIVFLHEDDRSLAKNRFRCPGHYEYTQPIYGCTILVYGDDSRWHIAAQNGYAKRALVQSLQFYPNIQIGTNASPISGTLDDWEPVGETTFGGQGIAGSDLSHKTHTYWRVFTHADGATITGIEGGMSGPGETLDASDFGAVKVLKNFGPGVLTIAHLGTSESKNQIRCPNQRDLKIPRDGAVWLIKAWYSGPEASTNPQWQVLATAFSNEEFPTITTTGRATIADLTLSPQVSPSALAAGLTSNWDPAAGAVIAVSTTSPASSLDGLVPKQALTGNEIRVLRNKGPYPLFLIDELSSASSAANRFALHKPGMAGAVTANPSIYVVNVNQEVLLQYQPTVDRWVILGAPSRLEDAGGVIQPAVLAASDVNNYSPTDSTSGLPGRYAFWWQIQGQVGTNLTGINATPSNLPPFVQGDELLLTNLGSGLTIKDFSASSSTANRFRLPGGDVVLSQYGTVRLRYSGVWHIVTKN